MDNDRHASRPRRFDPRNKPLSNGPPQLSPIDRIISLHHGSTTAIEATPQRLQESKQYPVLNLPERIEQLQKQKGSLNREVAYYREMEHYRKEFECEIARVKKRLEEALSRLARSQQRVGDEWARLRQGSSAHAQKNVQFASEHGSFEG